MHAKPEKAQNRLARVGVKLQQRCARNMKELYRLQGVKRDGVADPRHVSIAADRIGLSSIFEWYREDFESHAASRLGKGGAGALLDFIAHFLDEERAGHLRMR